MCGRGEKEIQDKGGKNLRFERNTEEQERRRSIKIRHKLLLVELKGLYRLNVIGQQAIRNV
jgi:hypothetical protein